MSERNNICYDLEGPFSSQDNAYRLCVMYVTGGDRVFSVISRYDDLLALANREGHEPGDTLALIFPFLFEAGVTENDVRKVSAEAGLVPGIHELIAELQRDCWIVWVISTSFEQHAHPIAERVGIPLYRVYCTKFPLNQLRKEVGQEDLNLVRDVRERIANLYMYDIDSGKRDKAILRLLNSFYQEELPKIKLGQAMAKIRVMGGRRKVWALEETNYANNSHHLSDAVVVIDSITDWRMGQAIEAAGGLAIAWNANWYAIPYSTCGVAAVDARTVKPLLMAWRQGGRLAVKEFVESASLPEDPEKGPHYHWLAGQPQDYQEEVLEIHKRLRETCRGAETARLG